MIRVCFLLAYVVALDLIHCWEAAKVSYGSAATMPMA